MGSKYLLLIVAAGLLFSGCRQQVPTGKASAIADSSAVQQADSLLSEGEAVNAPLSYAARNGRRTYDKYCAICHGTEGAGDGFNSYNLSTRPKDFTEPGYLAQVKDSWLREVIEQGGRGAKRSILMPAYENTLTRNQIEDIVVYVRHLSR